MLIYINIIMTKKRSIENNKEDEPRRRMTRSASIGSIGSNNSNIAVTSHLATPITHQSEEARTPPVHDSPFSARRFLGRTGSAQKSAQNVYLTNKQLNTIEEEHSDKPSGFVRGVMMANLADTLAGREQLKEIIEAKGRLTNKNMIENQLYPLSAEEKDITESLGEIAENALQHREEKGTLEYYWKQEPRDVEEDDIKATQVINTLTTTILHDVFDDPTNIGNKWMVDGDIENIYDFNGLFDSGDMALMKQDKSLTVKREDYMEDEIVQVDEGYGEAFFYALQRSDDLNKEITLEEDPEEFKSMTMSEFDKLISPMGLECVMDNLNKGLKVNNNHEKKFVGSKFVGSKFLSSDETKEKVTEEEEYDDDDRNKRVLLTTKKGRIETVELESVVDETGVRRRSGRIVKKTVEDGVVEREVRGRSMAKIDRSAMKKRVNEVKNKDVVDKVSGTTLSIGAAPSDYIYELAQDLKLTNLIEKSGKDLPTVYANLMYDYFQFRRRPDDWQISGATARQTAQLGIAEQTQFKDIWGTWIFEYSCGMASKWGDGVYDEDYKICCYICKKPIVNAIDKNKVEHGANKRLRTCPEMEHVYPCIKAYSSAPMYLLLDYYKLNGKQIHKEWKKYVDVYEIPEERYDALRKLYYEINCQENFNSDEINKLLGLIKDDFKNFIFEEREMVVTEGQKFDWAFEIIKYWLFEFAYAHHLCNQEKSNLDITNKQAMNKYYNDLKKRWMRTKDDIKDTIDKKEGMYVFGGTKDRMATAVTAYFKKNEGVLKKNLNDRFSYTQNIITNIGSKYLHITKVDFDNFKDDEKIKKISEIALMRSVMLSAKWYKSQVKAKGLENVKGNTSRSRSRGRSQSPRGQSPRGQSPRGQSPRGQSPRGQSPRGQSPRGQSPRGQSPRGQRPDEKAKPAAKRRTKRLLPGQQTLDGTMPEKKPQTIEQFLGIQQKPVDKRARRAEERGKKKAANSHANEQLKKGRGGRRTRKNKRRKTRRKTRRKRIYRRRMTMKRRKN
jgi:hypothetical protein